MKTHKPAIIESQQSK